MTAIASVVSLLFTSILGAEAAPKPVDLDRDGALDLVLVDASGAPRLLRNGGDGRFEEIADRAGLPASVGGLHWHDVDGDGDLDVLVLGATESGEAPRLFENAGPLVFAEFERAFELSALDSLGEPEWLDFDGDARCDLVWSAPGSVQLLRQIRRGVFEATTVLSVRPGPSSSLSAPPPNVGSMVGTSTPTGLAALANAPTMICAGTLVDSASGVCIEASSAPTLGELYPLSTNFNLDGSGRVGMGTTSPLERLDVAGRVRAQQGVRFGDGTLQTSAGTRDWNQLLNVPAGFADGVDNDTLYGAGTGLSLSGTTFSIAGSGVGTAQLASSAVTGAKVASGAIGSTQLASDATSLAKVTGGGASMAAGSLMVNTVTPAGRVRIRHSSSTASPHLMLTQDGGSDFARIGMDNPLSAQTWVMAGSLTAAPANDRLNVFHSTAGDVLSIGGNNRVGVNTVNPLTALHVVGSLQLQGTGQDISVPANETLQMGHYDGVTFTPRLSIGTTGQVVTTGGLTVGGALQIASTLRWLTVTGAAFAPSLQMWNSEDIVAAETNAPFGTTCRASANLSLPHGATISSITARVVDTSSARNLSVFVRRRELSAAQPSPETLATLTTSGSSGIQLLSTSSISSPVIDNENYAYFISVDTTSPAQFTDSLALYAVRFGYSVTSPLP